MNNHKKTHWNIGNIRIFMHKELLGVLLVIALAVPALTGCGDTPLPDEQALMLDENQSTSLGLHTDSCFEEFMDTYGEFRIQHINEDGSMDTFSFPKKEKDVTPTVEDGEYLAACFYVDGEPTPTEELPEDLTNDDYLNEHKVVYRFMKITFTDNRVSEISCDYLDYNKELY